MKRRSPALSIHFIAVVLTLTTFETANADMFVEYFQASNVALHSLADADNLISASSPSASATVPIANLIDNFDPPGSSRGRFSGDALFPGVSSVVGDPSGDNFAVRLSGLIEVPISGTYTFGSTTDDGIRLSIDGTTILEFRGAPYEGLSTINLNAGRHTLAAVYFAEIFSDSLEIYTASGTSNEFTSDFRLLGDVANGGLSVFVPEPSGMMLAVIAGLLSVSRRCRMIVTSLRIQGLLHVAES